MCEGVHGDDKTEYKKQEGVKRCPKCGETKGVNDFSKARRRKDGLQHQCKACKAKYYAKNAEKIKAQMAKCYAENTEKIKARHAKYRAENTEKIKARRAKYRAENPEKFAAYDAKYRAENPDKVKAKNQRRRARKRGAAGTFTANDWKQRLAYHGYRCIYCGVEKSETPQGWLTCEHLIPLSRGGTNWPSNLAPSCLSCNCKKSTKTHFEFIEYLDGK